MKNKDTIYVDVDDEITGIIDKVTSSKEKIVALVLPKRASVFQSVVNMKLLKKVADQKEKNLVLVTSEAGILPLAGAVGLHVAKTLQSTPEIPATPHLSNKPIDVEEVIDQADGKLDASKPIGQLAGLPPLPMPATAGVDDAIEVNNDDEEEEKPKASKKDKNKGPKKQKIKIPNFERFRVLLAVGVLVLILLIVGIIFAAKVLPKATITVKTNTSSEGSDLSLTLSSTATSLDTTNLVVPAKLQQIVKTQTSPQVTTTGSKTIGTAASGSLTVTNDCQSTSSVDVPQGTEFTDQAGNDFTSTSDVTVPGSQVTVTKGKPSCSSPTASVPITANAVGAGYNDSATVSFTTEDSDLSGYNISGTTSGGNSSQVQTVSQADITSAQSQLSTISTGTAEQTLEQDLKEAGLLPIKATFVAGTPSYSPSADVDSQANTVTVTESVTYTMYGAQSSQLDTLIDNNVNQQIDTSTQSILDPGLNSATFNVLTTTPTTVSVTMDTSSTVGPIINANSLKTQAEGKKSGDIQSLISGEPGVASVNVHFSPFWVDTAPKKPSKIKVVIEKADGSAV